MMIEADVKCYYCGHVSGQVVGEAGHPFRLKTFRPTTPGKSVAIKHGQPIRCLRCGGPVFLDEITVVKTKRRSVAKTREYSTAAVAAR